MVQVGLSQGDYEPITAAIGDGGNDVAMLLQALIGVGIYGKEGLEAARSADYSIPEFRNLSRLFLLHGHWASHRLTFTMNIFYYKCTTLVITQALLQFYSGYSQMVGYGSLLFALYNLTMTSIACLLYGMFERHLSERILIGHPYLYRAISGQANLRSWYVLLWVLDGMWHGTVIFYIVYFAFGGGLYHAASSFPNGDTGLQSLVEFDSLGTACYVCLVLSTNLRIAILARDVNLVTTIGFLIFILNTAFLYANDKSIFVALATCPGFWFTTMLSVFVANLPAILWRVTSDTWWSVKIFLCSIHVKKMRRKYQKSVKFWFWALVHGREQFAIKPRNSAAETFTNER